MYDWKKILLDKQYIKLSIFLIVTALTLYILYSILSHTGLILTLAGNIILEILRALSPLIYGLIIAYFFSPLVNIIDHRLLTRVSKQTFRSYTLSKQIEKRRRTLSIILAFIVIIIVLSLLGYTLYSMIIGKLTVEKIDTVGANIIHYFSKYEDFFNLINEKLSGSGLTEEIKDPMQMFIEWISGGFLFKKGVDVANWISGFGGNVLNIFLGSVIAFYLLKDQEFFIGLWKRMLSIILPRSANSKLMDILSDIHLVVSRFFRGQLLDGLIVGVLSSIGLFIIGVDFAIFIGMFAGIANVIPYFGPIIGVVPAVIMALLDGNLTQALLSIVVLLGIQQVDGAVIAPRVVGNSVGLHPVFVLLAVIIGGKYLGIIGMLIAVPIAAILKLFIVKLYHSKYYEHEGIKKEQL